MNHFDDSKSDSPPLHEEATEYVDSWSGYALDIHAPGFIAWNQTYDGKPVIQPDQGSLRFWYAPAWTSGKRSDPNPGYLMETIAWTKKSFPLLSVSVSSDGTGLNVSTGSGSTLMQAPIRWVGGAWHQIVVTYSAKETGLYIDGVNVSKGPGIAVSLKSSASFGLCIGSSFNGDMQADGEYDELNTFSYPLTSDEVAQNYNCYALYAGLGPITQAEEDAENAAAIAASSSRMAMTSMNLLLGLDCTSGPLHLTNIVFVSTNEVDVTIAGGQPNTLYDVFRTTALLTPVTNASWTWVGRGHQCDTIQDTNPPSDMAFYLAADTTDSNHNGQTDAYERLVLKPQSGPPTVNITVPANNASIAAPTNIVISTDTGSTLPPATVRLYANGQIMATGYGSSPNFQWVDPIVGSYDFQAIITDGGGINATSSIVHVSITLPEVASLKCWLKADGLSLTNNALVTSWPDSSGNNNNGSAGSTYAPAFLTNQINGQAAVKFNGTNTYVTLPAFLNGVSQGEIFGVVKAEATNGPLWYLSTSTQPSAYNSSAIGENTGRSTNVSFVGNPSITNFHILDVSAKANEWAARLNGMIQFQDAPATINFGSSLSLGRSLNGSVWTYGRPWISEILVYNKVLTEVQRLAIGRYLNAKYRIVETSPGQVTLACQSSNPRQIQVTWNSVTNASLYALDRQIGYEEFVPLFTTHSKITNYTDTIASLDSITYRLTARNYQGDTNGSLLTPLMVFAAPIDESITYVGQPMAVTLIPYAGLFGGGTVTPVKVETYVNGLAYLTQTNSPWGFSVTNSMPMRWNIQTRTFDTAGNSRFSDTFGINVLAYIDSDGDGVPDNQDYFPFDPNRWNAPTPNQNDKTAPIITIVEP